MCDDSSQRTAQHMIAEPSKTLTADQNTSKLDSFNPRWHSNTMPMPTPCAQLSAMVVVKLFVDRIPAMTVFTYVPWPGEPL